MASIVPDSVAVNNILLGLRSKSRDDRERAASELRDHLVSVAPEMPPDQFTRHNNDINKQLFELLRSPDVSTKLGAIMAIEKIVQADTGEETAVKITRYANYLRSVVLSNDVVVMRAACNAMGKLTLYSGLAGDLVDFEVKKALEWLQSDRQETRRHAAVLSIQALAKYSPTLLYSYVGSILDNIWIGLRDPKVTVRSDSAVALSGCLEIIYQRDSGLRQQWYTKILDGAHSGLKIGTVESIHGSLLVLRELLRSAGMFMQPRYTDTCETVLRYKDYKEPLVRRTVISIIPDLAKYNPNEFTKRYLVDSMAHLIGQLKRDRGRSLVFESIGLVARSVRSNMSFYLEPILENVREGLSSKGRARREQEGPIFQCLGMLASAVGQALAKHISREILELIFSSGLSEALNDCLTKFVTYIPPLQLTIRDRLLNMLSYTLSGNPFRPPGNPNAFQQMNETAAREYREAMLSRDGLSNEMSDESLITLALQMLGSFDFKAYSLSEFVKTVTVTYLEHPDPGVRKAAVITSCSLYVNDPICHQVSAYALRSVSIVLEKLLMVAISDPSADIRCVVLRSLTPILDPHLSQAENVRLLFMVFNDEVFSVRYEAITVIGRLTQSNPAYVVPSLRKTLIQLLTEIEFSSNSRNREESAKLLAALVHNSKSLVKPYVKSVLKVLLAKARDTSATVSASILAAIGEVARVGGEQMEEYFSEIMPLILETFQDQSSSLKRDSALKALGQLASSSGYVIEPLIQYPQLLDLLINILKTEQSISIKRETVRLMGILGALDPYRHREVERKNNVNDENENTPVDIKLLMKGTSPTSEEYYPTVVISTLMGLLKDSSLVGHHTNIAQAILFIFKSLGLKCVPFLNQIIPGLLSVMRASTHTMTEFFFRQLCILVNVVRQHIRPYLPSIFDIVKEFFQYPTLQPSILNLIEAIAQALDGEFKIHIPTLLPLLVGVLQNEKTVSHESVKKVMNSIVVFGSNIEEYIHLIVPSIVNLFEYSPVPIRIAAIECIGDLARTVNLNDMASRIIHPLLRVIASGNDELKKASVDTLCSLCFQMGNEFTVFIEVISKVLAKHKVHSSTYDQLVTKLLNHEPLPQNLNPYRKRDKNRDEASPANVPSGKLPVNQQHLKMAWDTSQRSTRDDWHEWIRRFSVELLKESPSHAIRACASIAVVYTPLARDLFNASFFSCWTELYDQYKEDLVKNMEAALVSPNIPPEILQILLNLAEFMEHDEKPLPMDIRTLAHYAQKCHAFAKALHYKELEFIQEPSSQTIESLISINNHLQQTDAAIGILKHAQRHHNLPLKETWFEKLHRWEDALESYNKKTGEEANSIEVTLGKMRCLHALGEWEQLSKIAQEKWTNSPNEVRRAVAPLAAAASWGLGQWERMDTYISVMKPDSPDRSFFNSILYIHRGHFEEASKQIINARDQLITELTALVSESYNRAYGVVVRVQMLSELEEIITYKLLPSDSEERATMRRTWMKRLKGCQRNVDIWHRMLKVRTLVVTPKQDMDMWIKFANLCRKSGRYGIAEKSLNQLLEEGANGNGGPNSSRAPPQVVYAQLKYMWSTHNRREALDHLVDFTTRMANDLNLDTDDLISQPLPSEQPGTPQEIKDYTKLLARCFLKQGEWKIQLLNNWKEEAPDEILGSYLLATHFDKSWYKAWHNWALANFEVVSLHDQKVKAKTGGEKADVSDQSLYPYEFIQQNVVPAVKGFFQSIALTEQRTLQDTLRLLTLWFKFGGLEDAAAAMNDGFEIIRSEVWLEVLPQLITRIHQPEPTVSKALHGLLTSLGQEHPQVLVYPLTVAIKSDSISRQVAASNILDKMRAHSATLVDQAELVSHELIRVAVLWHEQWHEGLEDASRFFFGEYNIEKMFATLEPLHKALEKGPETLREVSFQTAFGRDLHDAYEWALSFKRTGDLAQLNQAWDIYYTVFRRITRQLPQLQTLDLQYVSPRLLKARNLELAVPGTYGPGKPVIGIEKFDSTFTVISSKQRPRKVRMSGSDGKNYQYLLKGHEDIRQDNLVMQLFGLVNTLLADDPESFKRHLNIQRYPAIALSPKSGLLGWVPHSDTLHYLIREYREGKILLNIEHRIMLQMAPDYDNLTHLQKIEVFTYALDNTRGQDLYRVLWLKSRSSEAWLDRRTQYTRSLAVMSMVGYILGLGDRHPSNLMLDRFTGKVIHIDFGDCFEAAMLREKYPEKVPFRLTRMLTYAMEVSGIEGSFRITCEHVMRLLRDNEESLMAILEAFAYDPLINWGFELPTTMEPERAQQRRASLTYGAPDPAELKRRAQLDETEAAKIEQEKQTQARNHRAETVLKRITDKLHGNDFKNRKNLDVPDQVDRLIQDATNIENLCQHYIGWCSFW